MIDAVALEDRAVVRDDPLLGVHLVVGDHASCARFHFADVLRDIDASVEARHRGELVRADEEAPGTLS